MTDTREDAAPTGAERPRRRLRRRTVILLVLAGIAVALAVAVALLVRDVLVARDSLESAQRTVGQIRDAATEAPQTLPALADRLEEETGSAASASDGVLWRAAETLPVLGRNLTVVRELASAVDRVAVGAVAPLAEAASTDIAERLRPVDGRIDVDALSALVEQVADASAVVSSTSKRVASIDAAGTVEQVAAGQERLSGLLAEAAEQLQAIESASAVLPGMLGADGPRNYLLLFQNPAEARSLGGNPAAMLLLTVDEGAVGIGLQASSADFPRNAEAPIPVDPNLTAVYYDRFPNFVMDIGTRPDFPTMAALAEGYWERQFGGQIDAVVSFDPVALADLLNATGPVTLATGEQLTADNAVSLLLYEVYVRYVVPAQQDAFFAASARSVFDALVSGSADPGRLLDSLTSAAEQRRLLAWSARPAEQEVFRRLGVSGELPSDNASTTAVGVFFNDHSSSKIDFFVDTAVRSAVECSADGSRVYTVSYTVSSRLTPEQVDDLPDYVSNDSFLPKGVFRTDAYLLGPVGSAFLDWRVDEPGDQDQLVSAGSDLGRPVVRLMSVLGPAGSSTFTARFAAPGGEYGPLSVITTPMVNATGITTEDADCG